MGNKEVPGDEEAVVRDWKCEFPSCGMKSRAYEAPSCPHGHGDMSEA